MVIRAGIGMFYENAIWNNAEFDRPERLATGAFLANPTPCISDSASAVFHSRVVAAQLVPWRQPGCRQCICSALIGATLGANAGNCNGLTAAQCIANFQTTYQGASAAVG